MHLHQQAGAGGVHVEGGHLQSEAGRDVAGVGGRQEIRRGAAGDQHPDLAAIDPGALDRELRRAPAELGGGIERGLGGGAQVLVARGADVVERQRRAPRADAHPLEDPLVGGPDLELLEKAVRDLVLGMEVPEPVEEERHEVAPEMCSPPSTRITSPLIQAASSSESR
jgi:hypothetical protein